MELRLPSTSGLFAPKSELRDARSATIIGLHALALLLFSWKPLIAGALLAVGFVLTFGLTRPIYLAVICVGMLWVNDYLSDFWPFTQYTAWKDVLLIAIAVGWFFRSVMLNRTPFPLNGLTLSLTVVITFFLMNTMLSNSFIQAALGLKATVFYTIWYFITPEIVKSKRDVALLVGALMFGVACVGVYNMWRFPQPFGAFPMTRVGKILPGASVVHWSGSKNLLAIGMLIGTTVLGATRGWMRFLVVVSLLLGGIGFLLTDGRAQFLAVIVAFMAMGFLSGRLFTYIKVLFAALIMITILQAVFPIKIAERAASAFSEEDVSRQDREAEAMNVAVPYVLTHPFGAGTGALGSGNSSKVWAKSKVETVLTSGYVHNNFLFVAIETGWLGAAAWIWFLVAIIFSSQKAFLETRDPFLKNVALGLYGVMIVYTILNFFAPMLMVGLISFEFWILLGLIPVIHTLDNSEDSQLNGHTALSAPAS